MSKTPSPAILGLSPREIRNLANIGEGMIVPSPAEDLVIEKFGPVLEAFMTHAHIEYFKDTCAVIIETDKKLQERLKPIKDRYRGQPSLPLAEVKALEKAGKEILVFNVTNANGTHSRQYIAPTEAEHATYAPFVKKIRELDAAFSERAEAPIKEVAAQHKISLGETPEEIKETVEAITEKAYHILMRAQTDPQLAPAPNLPNPIRLDKKGKNNSGMAL